jgi:hypothetical protein
MGRLGMAELVIMLICGGISLVPLAIAIWIIVTLHRIRSGQEAVFMRLEAIERSIHNNLPRQ